MRGALILGSKSSLQAPTSCGSILDERQSADVFDRNITHYSYFGAFRSDVSNVGANAAMLTQDGKLTDIGSWYMGGAATHNIPMSSDSTRNSPVPAFLQRLLPSGSVGWSCFALPFAVWSLLV